MAIPQIGNLNKVALEKIRRGRILLIIVMLDAKLTTIEFNKFIA